MAMPNPYPADSQAAPAAPSGDNENDMGDSEDSAAGGDSGADESTEGECDVLKNHLYLPGNFPGDKAPKPGDEKDFMVHATFVEMKDGEQCWDAETVDGVPISDEDEDDQAAGADGEDGSMTDEAQVGDEGEPTPGPTSKGNDFTAIILGKKKK